ncbi:hypothetical protein [Streptomyces macrosporus]|uniref:Uncharacterized protein n=1 Tax=Streptomyces macrosporus TaxID=44032 RepID=A0ABP5XMF7_9ACTN
MPYGTPTDPRYTDYNLQFRDVSTDKGAEYVTYFHVRVDPVSAPIEDVEAAFQRLVDLVNASPDFGHVYAMRTGEVTQDVTPTEAAEGGEV